MTLSPQPQPTQVGRIIIISGPAGAGKTSLVRRLFQHCPLALERSISATTRAPRRGESDGVDYHFLTSDEFARRRAAGDFLECCEVFGRGDWYGTLAGEVAPRLAEGKWVVLEIDVQGAMKVLEQYPDAVTVFVMPPGDIEELERRLVGRGSESEQSLARRLEVAHREISMSGHYRHRVINDDLDQAVHEVCDILKQYV
jgi:guanylate kinase